MPSSEFRSSVHADLNGDGNDPALARLTGDLTALYTAAAMPAALRDEIAHAIDARAGELRDRRPARVLPLVRTGLSRRISLDAALLPFVLALSVAAGVTLSPIVERALRERPMTERIATDDLGVALNLSQTVDGVTVTLERAYADPLQVVIAYNISGPDGAAIDTPDMALTDLVHGTRLQSGSFQWLTGWPADSQGGAAVFDGSRIAGNPTELELRFELAPLGVLNPFYTNAPTPGQPPVPTRVADGPHFTFDFSVPFHAGRRAEPNQATTVNGGTATLVSATTTPTGTRIYLRGAGPNAKVTLTVAGQAHTLTPAYGFPCPWPPDQAFAYDTPDSLLDSSEPWAITVAPIPLPDIEDTAGCPAVIGGPWQFEVTMP